jgi:signal transduction histidine kinase
MPSGPRKSSRERAAINQRNRERTDKNLSHERSRTDSELAQREGAVQARADSVVRQARKAADEVLNAAREKEDEKLDQHAATSSTRDAVKQNRLQADSILGGERSDADRTLRGEHDELKRAVAGLLALEREETNNALLLERVSQLKELSSVEHALEYLKVRLDDQSQALDEALRTRDSFLSMASHELRTPLTALQLQVQGLLHEVRPSGDLVPRVVLKRLALIERNVKRLEALVGDLLDLFRLSTGRLKLEVGRVDLSALVGDVANRLESFANEAGCEVVQEIEPHVTGAWDRDLLERVINKLLTNAIKYGLGKPITIRLKRDGSVIKLSFEDHGIGVDPKDYLRIFQRLERAVSEWYYGGLGLGLWIVKRIVNASGGEVSVSSQLGAGATFTVELPIEGAI